MLSRTVDFYQKRKKGKYRLVKAPKLGPVADTHCHIEMLEDPAWAFVRCAMHNVKLVACVIDPFDGGIDKVEAAYEQAKQMLPQVIEDVRKYGRDSEIVTITENPELCLDINSIADNPVIPEFKFMVGYHPHNAKDFDVQKLEELLSHPKCCAVGEIGLDFHYDLSPRDTQIDVFKKQLQIAKEHCLPVSLHIRGAHDMALDIMEFSEYGTLLHCFNLGPEDVKPWLDKGCYIALGGPVTFKKSDYVREAISCIPEDRLLTETDAPYMAPEPLRGDTCYPDHVIFVAKTLNRDLSQVYKNAEDFLCKR